MIESEEENDKWCRKILIYRPHWDGANLKLAVRLNVSIHDATFKTCYIFVYNILQRNVCTQDHANSLAKRA